MAKHYTKLIIEINEDITSKVTAVKGDVNSRYLDVQLFNDSVPLDLTSHTVTMSAKSHPDSNFKVPINKFIDGQITEAINGRCQFKLETDILGQTGVIILQISVFSGEQEVLSTNPFNLYVIDSPRNDEQIEASNEFGALVVLFSEIQNALDDMHAIRDNFGTPSEESLQAGTDTFWKALEKSIKGSSDLVAYNLPSKIGDEFDDEPFSTVFGKLNRIIKLQLKDGEEIFRSDGKFIVPDGVNQITVIAAGGGGGGGASNGFWSPGGGGGGACIVKTTSVSPGQEIQITIGKGGEPGRVGDSQESGKDGTATVVGSIVTAPGGHGGPCKAGDAQGGEPGGTGGGKGGTPFGDVNGENGLYGNGGTGFQQEHSAAGGGGGSYGNGGNASTESEDAKDGVYGGGGGGCVSLRKAGKGGDGIVIIRWGGRLRMIYAMILENRVIDLKESKTAPYYPPDIDGNPVFAVETTEETEVGMCYHMETGKFDWEFPIVVPEKSQLDRIEERLSKSINEIRAEGAAMASVNLMTVGAEMTKALAAAKMDVPATAGTFAKQWDEWTPDEKTATAKSLWQYKGIGYQARMDIQKIEVYAPDVATNNYAVRPIPDVNGIFPGVLNMDVSIGMKVRDWEDGKVYICYANPITSLQWAPHNVPASFELYEG